MTSGFIVCLSLSYLPDIIKVSATHLVPEDYLLSANSDNFQLEFAKKVENPDRVLKYIHDVLDAIDVRHKSGLDYFCISTDFIKLLLRKEESVYDKYMINGQRVAVFCPKDDGIQVLAKSGIWSNGEIYCDGENMSVNTFSHVLCEDEKIRPQPIYVKVLDKYIKFDDRYINEVYPCL